MPSEKIIDFTGGLWIPEESAPTQEEPGFAVPQNALLQAMLDQAEIVLQCGTEKSFARQKHDDHLG